MNHPNKLFNSTDISQICICVSIKSLSTYLVTGILIPRLNLSPRIGSIVLLLRIKCE